MELKPGYKQTELGVIPEDWDVSQLRRHLLQDATYGVVKAGAFQRVGIPMLRGGDIKAGAICDNQPLITAEKSNEYSRTVLKEGDVVIALVGYPGETAVVPARLAGANISRAVGLLRPAKTLQPEFLACYLNSPHGRKEFLRPSAGSAQIVVNLGALNQLRLPLPNITEQRAIADALSDVDALLGELDNLIIKKRGIKLAAMQELLTGKRRLPGFEGEWEVVEFGEIASIRNNRVVASTTPPGTQCVELEGIEGKGGGRLLMSTEATGKASKYSFKKGDVLFGRLRAYLRKHWLATFDGICSTEIWPLTPRDKRLFTGFLHLLVQTDDFVNAAGVSYGTHMPRTDWSVIKKFLVRLPELCEQTAIASILSDMDDELVALESHRDKTRALKHGMMQELLTGRTRLVKPA